jgi:hypothetical protein
VPCTYEDETITLPHVVRYPVLADAVGTALLSDTTFRRCMLSGPIHLRIKSTARVELTDCTILPEEETAVVRVADDELYLGAADVRDCVFDACTFENVRLVLPPGRHAGIENETAPGRFGDRGRLVESVKGALRRRVPGQALRPGPTSCPMPRVIAHRDRSAYPR